MRLLFAQQHTDRGIEHATLVFHLTQALAQRTEALLIAAKFADASGDDFLLTTELGDLRLEALKLLTGCRQGGIDRCDLGIFGLFGAVETAEFGTTCVKLLVESLQLGAALGALFLLRFLRVGLEVLEALDLGGGRGGLFFQVGQLLGGCRLVSS